MGEEVMLVVRERGEALRYATVHFQDLQGLRLAPFWAFLLGSLLFGITRSSDRAILMAMVTGALVLVTSQLWARKWYRSRYGVVIKPINTESASRWQGWLMALILGLGIVSTFFRRFDNKLILSALMSYVPVLLPRCFDHAASPGALLRKLLYSASLIVLLAFSTWFLFEGLSGRQLVGSIAGCWLVLSLYDHWLLDHILRPKHSHCKEDL